MKQTTKYVGLDVHQATTVAVVRDDSGRVIACNVLPTQAAAFLEFFRGMRGAVHVTFEEGTRAGGRVSGLLPGAARARHARGPGPSDPNAETRGAHVTTWKTGERYDPAKVMLQAVPAR